MNFYPILFSTEMVESILLGIKTMTRRNKNLEKINKQPNNYYFQSLVHHATGKFTFVHVAIDNPTQSDVIEVKCPYGKVGDVLWVRESFYEPIFEGMNGKYYYKADLEKQGWNFKWERSIHMPKSACRIFLQITNIRVERLQDITEEDAIAEGVKLHESGTHYLNYYDQKHRVTQFIYNCKKAYDSFRFLWYIINGKRDEPFAWFKNPWVWVIEFEKIEKPIEFTFSKN